MNFSDDWLYRLVLLAQGEPSDCLRWAIGPDMLPSFVFDCSDTFGWAIADSEPIETHADLDLLERTGIDLLGAGDIERGWLPELYAARRRKQRPFKAFLDRFDETPGTSGYDVRVLFEACGPERDDE